MKRFWIAVMAAALSLSAVGCANDDDGSNTTTDTGSTMDTMGGDATTGDTSTTEDATTGDTSTTEDATTGDTSTTEDTATDTGEPQPGTLGADCATPQECTESGLCLTFTSGGGYCSQQCDFSLNPCPDGFSCQEIPVSGGDPINGCVRDAAPSSCAGAISCASDCTDTACQQGCFQQADSEATPLLNAFITCTNDNARGNCVTQEDPNCETSTCQTCLESLCATPEDLQCQTQACQTCLQTACQTEAQACLSDQD